MIKNLSGGSGIDFVKFVGEKYESTTHDDMTCEVKLKENNVGKYLKSILYIILFIELINFVLSKGFNIKNGGFIVFSLFMVYILLNKQIRNTRTHHGAEHKVYNCYKKGKELTLENVQIETRLAVECGTNLIIFIYALFTIIYFVFIHSFTISFILGVILAIFVHSAFATKKGGIIMILLIPILFIALIIQFSITTREPNNKEILVAINSLKELIKTEDAEII